MSRKWIHKLCPKKKVIDWYNAQTDRVKSACFLEQELGSACTGGVHLCVNGETGRSIIARVGKRAFDWFEIKPLSSDFINIRYFGITGLKQLSLNP